MNRETLIARIAERLPHGPVDVRELVASFYPHDIEAGRTLEREFRAHRLCGRLSTNFVEFDGHVGRIGAMK